MRVHQIQNQEEGKTIVNKEKLSEESGSMRVCSGIPGEAVIGSLAGAEALVAAAVKVDMLGILQVVCLLE